MAFGKEKITTILLCVLASFVLWMYVAGSENKIETKTFYNINVELLNLDSLKDSGLMISPNQEFTADVEVRANYLDLINFSSTNISATADMGMSFKAGENNIPISVISKDENVSISFTNGYYSIKPHLEKIYTKQILVCPRIIGALAPNHIIDKNIVLPESIEVIGAKEYCNQIKNIQLDINVANLDKDKTFNFRIEPLDKEGNIVENVEFSTSSVAAKVYIKSYKTVPIKINTTKLSKRTTKKIKTITVSPAKITLIGDEKLLSKITEVSTKPVKLNSYNGYTDKKVQPVIPKGIVTGTKNVIVHAILK